MKTYRIYLESGTGEQPFFYSLIQAESINEADYLGEKIAKFRGLKFSCAQVAVKESIEKANEKALINLIEMLRNEVRNTKNRLDKICDRIDDFYQSNL